MASPQVTARRKAEAREAIADIVEKLGAEDSEYVQRVKTYREAGVLTGNRSEDALETLVAALAEIVHEAKLVSAKKSSSRQKASRQKAKR
jgi:hypothetical protein